MPLLPIRQSDEGLYKFSSNVFHLFNDVTSNIRGKVYPANCGKWDTASLSVILLVIITAFKILSIEMIILNIYYRYDISNLSNMSQVLQEFLKSVLFVSTPQLYKPIWMEYRLIKGEIMLHSWTRYGSIIVINYILIFWSIMCSSTGVKHEPVELEVVILLSALIIACRPYF